MRAEKPDIADFDGWLSRNGSLLGDADYQPMNVRLILLITSSLTVADQRTIGFSKKGTEQLSRAVAERLEKFAQQR